MASSLRSKRPKAPPPKLNIEEMEQDPSMRGMLSFLEITPVEKLEMLRKRAAVDAASDVPFPGSAGAAAAPSIGAPIVDASIPDAPIPDAPIPDAASCGASVQGIVEELAAAPAEPRRQISELPIVDAPEPDAPEQHAALAAAPEVEVGEVGVVEAGAPKLGEPLEVAATPLDPHQEQFQATEPGAPDVSAPTFGAPDLGEVYVYRPVRPVLHPASTAQDGHTHGEQALFATLWRLARPSSRGPFRAISIGERTLGAEVPMAYSTVQENLRSLVRKLAIEIRVTGPRQPKTYIVYPYEEILRRRKAAGLTHVIRRTSGVMLVNPGAPNFDAARPAAPRLSFGAPNPGAPDSGGGAPTLDNSGAPSFGAAIRNKEIQPGTSSSKKVVHAIYEVFGLSDDDAARRIVESCRQRDPDATEEEMVYFIKLSGSRIRKITKIENPIGMLIWQVPKCFEGETIKHFRETERQRREAEQLRERQERRRLQEILRDPRSTLEEQQYARDILALLSDSGTE